MATFRDTAWTLSPSRLRTPRAAKMVYSFIGLPLDILCDSAAQAVKARFPELAPDDALPYLGRDRGIKRGPQESAASYRARLLLWRETARGAGVGRAMLDAIAAYLTPQAIRMRIWTQVGLVYTREPDGSFRIEHAAGVWNWDGRPDLWARIWVILYSVAGVPWSRDGTWGDGDVWGDDGTSWGSTASPGTVSSIRGIVSELKPAASACVSVLVSFDAAAFDPTSPTGLPDGTWGNASRNVGGVQVETRDPRAIYWEGVA